MTLNAVMNLMIKNFLLALLVIHSVTTDESQISTYLKEVLNQVDTGNVFHQYENNTLTSPMGEMDELTEQKTYFTIKILAYTNIIMQLRYNTSTQISKMLHDIENLKYLTKKSLEKENNPETLEDLFHLIDNEEQFNEMEKLLSQLQALESKVKEWSADVVSETLNEKHLPEFVMKFYFDENSTEEEPPKTSWNSDENSKDPSMKSYIDQECDELEKLRRLSLMVQDELKEMSKLKNEDNHEKSESKTQNAPPEVNTDLTRWLLNEKDIDEIQERYMIWIAIFTTSKNPVAEIMKQKITKSGQSIEAFCKTLVEFYNFTSKLMECEYHDDAECEKLIREIMEREHFKFVKTFLLDVNL